MSWIIPLLLLRKLSADERKQVTARILPLALPGSPTTKLAFATIEAERDVRRQAVVTQNLVSEAIKAGGITSADALVEFPSLNAAFNKLPAAVKSGIFSPTVGPAGDREVVLAPTPDAGSTASSPARGRSTNQPVTRPTP